jgi:hypothetical protein
MLGCRELCETAGENVTVTKHQFQAVTSNRNANELFACKWLRAPDLNQRSPKDLIPRYGGLEVGTSPSLARDVAIT